jgi:hypothetical protein
MYWEDVLKQNNLIGGDYEFITDTGDTLRARIDTLTQDGSDIIVAAIWVALKVAVGVWRKVADHVQLKIETERSRADALCEGSIRITGPEDKTSTLVQIADRVTLS